MRRGNFWLVLTLALWLVRGLTATAQFRYRVQLLEEVPGQSDVYALGVNDHQQAVGYVVDSTGTRQAVTWDATGVHPLPALGDGLSTWAFRLNNAGQIVGKAALEDGHLHAVLWSSSGIQDLGTLKGGQNSFANDINEHGVVAGSSEAATGQNAFTWTADGGFRSVAGSDPPLRLSVAGFNGINDAGLAVGTTYYLLEPYHAAYAQPDDKLVRDLAPPGRTVGMALAVNNQGTIVGYQSTPDASPQAAIFHEDGTFDSLGTLGLEESWAEDINDQGTIVGRAFGYGPGGAFIPRAFVYEQRKMDDLLRISTGTEGWDSFIEAASINQQGVIVGEGWYRGEIRAYMAVPVPEPASALPGLVGLGSLLLRSRRRSVDSPAACTQ